MTFESKYLSIEHYLRKLSGLEKDTLLVDHNYVKAWNAHPDCQRTKPARLLFMKGMQRYPLFSETSYHEEEVDIESCEEALPSPFDNPKTKAIAFETEKSLKNIPLFKDRENEEEPEMSKFSSRQRKLYQQVMNILLGDRLTKLCSDGTTNEPLKRRLATDRVARQLRQVFGLIFWNMELLSWLHETLLKYSDVSTLSTYIEGLQTLRSKVPVLVERILQSCAGTMAGDAVIPLVKKTWDPVHPVLNQNKPKRLPGNPIILICPSSPIQNSVNAHSQRLRLWLNTMSSMCKVMNIPVYSELDKVPQTIEEHLDQMMTCTRKKINELKNHYPKRPIILVGWTIGALIACHIALQEPVDGIICLGFPLTGVDGSRGDLNDPLLDNKVPTLFVVGQNARMCSTDDIEDFRARMKADTGLVIVGGCDDLLRMCPLKLKMECVTQSIVDRCLIDEVGEFLSTVVVKLPSTSSTAASPMLQKVCTPIKEEDTEDADEEWKPEDEGKRRRRKPREFSPELSPPRKRARHVSRQSPVSSSKARLSPTGSESSNSGSRVPEKPVVKPGKKHPEKRVGRPTAGTWHQRPPTALLNITKPKVNPAKMMLNFTAAAEPVAPPKAEIPKPKLPFSKIIQPNKNESVDVDAAFGSDTSFLPRPLTPPEPEDTVSADETESAMAELEAIAGNSDLHNHPGLSTSSIVSEIMHNDRSFLPITTTEDLSKTVNSQTTSSIVPAENVMATVVTTTAAATLTSTLQNVFPQGKFLTSSSIQSLRPISDVTGLKNMNSPNPSKSTIITVPSANAANLLVSNPSLRTQSGKLIQLLSRDSIISKDHMTSVAASTSTSNPVIAPSTSTGNPVIAPSTSSKDQQSCNLSLLSDVAGMKEHMHNLSSAPTATLVKLAAPERVGLPTYKGVTVVKPGLSFNPATRIETAEEMVEKQRAIQALNQSIGVETPPTTAKETGYSICYAKADGSIVSRSVPRPRFTTITPTSTIITSSVARGSNTRGGMGRGARFHFANFRFRFA